MFLLNICVYYQTQYQEQLLRFFFVYNLVFIILNYIILFLGWISVTFFSNNKINLIAEIANSHEGKIHIAKELVEKASKSGADIVKFQIFKTSELLEPNHEEYSIFKKLQLSQKEWINLIRFSKKKKIENL